MTDDALITREIPLSEALNLVENHSTPARARIVEALSVWSGPFLIYDGDLKRGGSLEVGARPTIVWGDLELGGTLLDRGSDASTLLVVLGDLNARNLVTRAEVCVAGELIVRDTIFGASAGKHALVVGGETRARAIVNDGHWFHLIGGAEAEYVFGHIDDVPHSGFQSSELFVSEVLDIDEPGVGSIDAALDASAVVERLSRSDDIIRESPTTRRQKMLGVLEEASEQLEQKVLVLEDAGLIEVPDEVFETVGLEKLVLDFNDIAQLPARISELKNLRYLSVDGTMMRRLPDEIGALENLEVLSLRFVRLKTLPDTLASLTRLRELYLTYSSLTEFPEVVSQLASLEKLVFWHCQPDDVDRLASFIAGLASAPSLRVLAFIKGEFTEFPPELAELTQIDELQVADLALGDPALAAIHRMLPGVTIKTSL